jgi:zinc D-Ala-D-Ala carboxypeptidase
LARRTAMNLSPHFTLEEFTRSSTAQALGIANAPESYLYPALMKTAYGLEEVRSLLGDKPIHINSGYRSPALNKAVGSKPTSQHISGCAVDFICPLFGTPEQIVRKIVASPIAYDQVILEHGNAAKWVHISFSDRNRKTALIIDAQGTREFT